MEKMYQVYSVDTYFDSYGITYELVGAESKEDLIAHLGDFIQYKKDRKRIESESEWRIKEIPHMFTDVPYEVIDSFGYYE